MVYFIQDSRTFAIKIGFTEQDEPDDRIAALQTGNPSELKVLCTIDMVGRDYEAILHEQFAPYRIAGEWFHPDPEIIRLMIQSRNDIIMTYKTLWKPKAKEEVAEMIKSF